MDITGKYVVASGGNGVYRSTNYGATWSQIYNPPAYSSYYYFVSSDTTGKYLASVLHSTGQVLISSDYGSSWTITQQIANLYSLAADKTGQYLTAAGIFQCLSFVSCFRFVCCR
jgi:hypothetical protein